MVRGGAYSLPGLILIGISTYLKLRHSFLYFDGPSFVESHLDLDQLVGPG